MLGSSDDEPNIEKTVYDLNTNTVTVYLSEKEQYDGNYVVCAGGQFYSCDTLETQPASSASVSIKNVSAGNDSADVYVYNACFTGKSATVKALDSDGNVLTSQAVTLEPESVSKVTINTASFNIASWTVE